MAELESIIEQKLIDQLCMGESQWTYRGDIHTEEDLWANFKYILEQNNKDKLDGEPLTDSEFAKIKNDVSHPSFYDAGKWLVGENGKVYVHVQRGNQTLHLLVLNNEHVAGGSSVYEIINQYQSLKTPEDGEGRNRRFDVTMLINGLPLIHIELKNKSHSYMEGFEQIKKYIGEGKFHGLFSNIQMFVVSNSVDTKYIAAARDTELNKKFLTGWLDSENQPVCNYLDFASSVLKIPEAHEIVTKYTVLDNDKKKLLILRPYQIHAIMAMRAASRAGKSGYIWHTTGSGKTMTSYKATRNLLMDIPSIEKTIFLIDRKDLDIQTKMAFQSYADNDTIDVDDTDNVGELIKRLADGNRQMIVTTRQKMQIMVDRRLKPGTKEYEKIKGLNVAFVVDECHRAVTPQTKRDLEKFFYRSMWYGFTGTPIFDENRYEQKGDLPQTTKELYGECLHRYTIKEAIHDEAVLGFMVENLGAKNVPIEKAENYYGASIHMRQVLDVILNKSYSKFGMQNGRGQTYEAILTVSSIAQAQRYYDLLKKVVAGEDELKISEDIKKALPDFPKFAITYSVSENEEVSKLNQDKMKESLADYNNLFGTAYTLENIGAYNGNLNDRLARKESKYKSREAQLDLVIVVNRLLTGFDAPPMAIMYMDRPPMSPQDIIQAFSRTNRLLDGRKNYGQIVTFQYPAEFKEAIDDALRLYSRGGDGNPISEDWETVLRDFIMAVRTIRQMGTTMEEIRQLSKPQKKAFVAAFRALDKTFAHLKAFSNYEPKVLESIPFSEEEYEDYTAIYKNIVKELTPDPVDSPEDDEPISDDYELVAVNKIKIDFDYIVELLRGFVENIQESDEDFARKLAEVKKIIEDFAQDNPKLSEMLMEILKQIEQDKSKFAGQDISEIIHKMRKEAINKEIHRFADKWYIPFETVEFEAYHFRNGVLSNETNLKEAADFAAYKENSEKALPKFKFFGELIKDFKEGLMPEITPLLE